MGRPTTQVLAKWVIEECKPSPERLDSICLRVLKNHCKSSSENELSDITEEECDQYLPEEIRNCASEYSLDGVPPLFEIDDEDIPYITRLTNPVGNTLLKRIQSADSKYFEKICAKILNILGGIANVADTNIDHGVDFVGFNIKGHAQNLPLPHGSGLTVIGQAKRYKDTNLVTENEMRNFIGGAMHRRHEFLVNGNLSVFGPLVLAYWTTSDLDRNAKEFARKMGIWYMGGQSLVHYIESLNLSEEIEKELTLIEQAKPV